MRVDLGLGAADNPQTSFLSWQPMKAFYCDQFVLPLPEQHRFPMSKYELLRKRVSTNPNFDLLVPDAATDEDLLLCHSQEFLQKVVAGEMTESEQRELGFPWSPEMVERSRRSVGATISAARVALEEGASANLAGGTHHATSDAAQGFCVFNDCVVAARKMQKDDLADQVMILDADVHQGNGTASICTGDGSIYTYSIHGESNYPTRKEPGDMDIGLEDGTTDETYLDSLRQSLHVAFNEAYPDLVFYLAGADPYEGDRLGRLNLSKRGLEQRDRIVMEFCARRSLPLVMVMAGGYANDVDDIVDIHYASLKVIAEYANQMKLDGKDFSFQ
jgi:acetoin utilization deacetylase AcuC-like enzyme|tara:strand:+ start:98538 stop:99530 length:993 start_codon:yes stop_codon:yes gene_type:complete